MKANELRVGNFVRYRDEFNCIVCNVGELGFRTDCKDLSVNKQSINCGSGDIEDYNPIPLTEGWLLKFGFGKYYPEASEWVIENPMFTIEKGREGYHFTGGEGVYFSRAINYVHDLQNLHFALTGEELTIKEPV